MATASIKPPQAPPTIVLELTVEEAAVLRDVAYMTGGDYRFSRRKLMDQINEALAEVRTHLPPYKVADINYGPWFKGGEVKMSGDDE